MAKVHYISVLFKKYTNLVHYIKKCTSLVHFLKVHQLKSALNYCTFRKSINLVSKMKTSSPKKVLMTKLMIMILMNLKTYLKMLTKTMMMMKTITMKMIVFLCNIR